MSTGGEHWSDMTTGDSLATLPDRHDHEDDPLERTELARRLRRMAWPPAPADVRDRVLQRIVESAREGDADGDGRRDPSN